MISIPFFSGRFLSIYKQKLQTINKRTMQLEYCQRLEHNNQQKPELLQEFHRELLSRSALPVVKRWHFYLISSNCLISETF